MKTLKHPIGSKVFVKREYQDCKSHRGEMGTVVRTQMNTTVCDEPFLDYYIEFPNGTIEAFGAWELEDKEVVKARLVLGAAPDLLNAAKAILLEIHAAGVPSGIRSVLELEDAIDKAEGRK